MNRVLYLVLAKLYMAIYTHGRIANLLCKNVLLAELHAGAVEP